MLGRAADAMVGGWLVQSTGYTILVGCARILVAEAESGWRYFLPDSQSVSLLCNFDLYGRVLKRFLTHKFSCSAIQLSKTHTSCCPSCNTQPTQSPEKTQPATRPALSFPRNLYVPPGAVFTSRNPKSINGKLASGIWIASRIIPREIASANSRPNYYIGNIKSNSIGN